MSDEKDKIEGEQEVSKTEEAPAEAETEKSSAVNAIVPLAMLAILMAVIGGMAVSHWLEGRLAVGDDIAIADQLGHQITAFADAGDESGLSVRRGSNCWLQTGGKVTAVGTEDDFILVRYTGPTPAREDRIFNICPDGTLAVMAESDVRYLRYCVERSAAQRQRDKALRQAESDFDRRMNKPKAK